MEYSVGCVSLKSLNVSVCALQMENRFFFFSPKPDPSYLFLYWIMPQTGQRRQSSVMTLQKIWALLTLCSCFNRNLGFNPVIILAAMTLWGLETYWKTQLGGVEIRKCILWFAWSQHTLYTLHVHQDIHVWRNELPIKTFGHGET